MKTKTIQSLNRYMPQEASPVIASWIYKTGCSFKISKTRRTKFGDYRPPFNGLGHRISVNHDLNPFAFLVTTVHEFAHLKTWEEFGRLVKPHGKEWKSNFKKLMQPFLASNIFPLELSEVLQAHIQNPGASSCTDPKLYKILQQYNQQDKATCFVEEIEPESSFATSNGKTFTKFEKRRTRYRCMDNKTKQMYLFPALAEVYPL